MKLLGHGYVAVNSVPSGNKKLLILGAIVPEIAYYTKTHPFTDEEIHEGGKIVYQYLMQKQSDFADFGLGMVSHSIKYGADHFNLDENLALLGFDNEKILVLRKEIAQILGITEEKAAWRVHNLLELAVEIGIIRNHPEFVSLFTETLGDAEIRETISGILSGCFRKPPEAVNKCVEELFNKAKPEYFTSSEGLAKLWAELSKDFDPPPDIERLTNFLDKLSTDFEGKDKKFLAECIIWTRGNIEGISGRPERNQ